MALSAEDRDSFIKLIKESFINVPGILKSYVNPTMILNYIEAIPLNFRKYTLQEIVDALKEAKVSGRL